MIGNCYSLRHFGIWIPRRALPARESNLHIPTIVVSRTVVSAIKLV